MVALNQIFKYARKKNVRNSDNLIENSRWLYLIKQILICN